MARKPACRKSLKHFPKPVADAVLHVVKEHEVTALMLDGAHVLLRAPHDTRKVSRSRKAEESVNYVRGLVGCEHQ